MKLILLCCLFVIPLTTHATSLEDRIRSVEQIQSMKERAYQLYQQKAFPEAEKAFYDVLSSDPTSIGTSFAVNHLKKIVNESGLVTQALKEYEDLVARGKAMATPPVWAGGIGKRFFDDLKLPGKLESYLLNSLKFGGILAARTSLIGVVLEQSGLIAPASFYAEKATMLIEQVQKAVATERAQQLKSRPLQYIWPSLYSELIGIPLFSSEQLEIIGFDRTMGAQYSEVELQQPLTGWKPHVNAAYFARYDSNVLDQSNESALTAGIANNSGALQHLFLNFGVQGNIEGERDFGWDYMLHARRYLRDDLSSYNTLTHLPSAFVSIWNRKDRELRLRYDLAFTLHRKVPSDAYHRSHGPQLAWSQLLGRKTLLTSAYSLRFNQDRRTPASPEFQRDGTLHSLLVRIAYPGENNQTQPYFRYFFERNDVRRSVENSASHRVDAGMVRFIGRTAVLDFYTSALLRRPIGAIAIQNDRIYRTALDIAWPLDDRGTLTVLTSGSYGIHQSDRASAEYREYVLSAGFSAHFGL